MAASRLVALEPYDEENESFLHYLERFDIYVEAYAIAKARRKAVFLCLLGASVYGRLRSLMTPVKPNDPAVTLDELKDILKEHLSPAPLEIAEAYRFHNRRQQPGERLRDFYAQLRLLAEHCNFGGFRDTAIRNQLVCGMLCDATRRRLLCEKDLTLETCVNIATAAEASAKASEAMSTTPPNSQEVHRVRLKLHNAQQRCLPYGGRRPTSRDCQNRYSECFRNSKTSKAGSSRAYQTSDRKESQKRQLQNLTCSRSESTPVVRLQDDSPLPKASAPIDEGAAAAAGQADGPWQCVYVDFAGPIDNVHFLLATDAFSKWPEVVVLPKATVAATIAALRTIFARQGLPQVVVTDNGPQFRSREFQSFLKSNCIRHCRTALYSRHSNDETERFVQAFMQAYRVLAGPAQLRVDKFLLKYRSTVLAATGCVPSEMHVGRRLRTLQDVVRHQPSSATKPATLRNHCTVEGTTKQREGNLQDEGRDFRLRSGVR